MTKSLFSLRPPPSIIEKPCVGGMRFSEVWRKFHHLGGNRMQRWISVAIDLEQSIVRHYKYWIEPYSLFEMSEPFLQAFWSFATITKHPLVILLIGKWVF